MKMKVDKSNAKKPVVMGDIIERNGSFYIIMQEEVGRKLRLRDVNGYNFYGIAFTDISEVIPDSEYIHYSKDDFEITLVRKEV